MSFSHEELVQAIKLDASIQFEVGSINTAVKRIQKKGLVKINSKNVTSYHLLATTYKSISSLAKVFAKCVQSWDEDGYRARWKFEVRPIVNCQVLKEQVLLQPVGIIMDVDSEFLDGTGKVRLIIIHMLII